MGSASSHTSFLVIILESCRIFPAREAGHGEERVLGRERLPLRASRRIAPTRSCAFLSPMSRAAAVCSAESARLPSSPRSAPNRRQMRTSRRNGYSQDTTAARPSRESTTLPAMYFLKRRPKLCLGRVGDASIGEDAGPALPALPLPLPAAPAPAPAPAAPAAPAPAPEGEAASSSAASSADSPSSMEPTEPTEPTLMGEKRGEDGIEPGGLAELRDDCDGVRA